MIKSIVVASLCFTAVQLRAEPELRGTPSEMAQYLESVSKTVTVVGDSELKVAVDQAFVSLKVVTENKSLQEALRMNQEIRGKIMASLKDQGIATDRMQASKFSSTPKYGMFGDKPKSYTVENVVKITVQNEKEFQVIAGLVDSINEVRYDGIEFQHSDKDSLKAKVLEQAIDKADERKRLYEEKLGVKLTPKSFSEGDITVRAPVTANAPGYGFGDGYGSSRVGKMTALPGHTPLPEDVEMPNEFGEVVYHAEVTVEYSVAAK